MAERSRLLRKTKRKQAQFRAAEPEARIKFFDDLPPTTSLDEGTTYHFFVGNGGMRSGLGSEVLTTLLDGPDTLYMPESRDFSFASVTGLERAKRLLQLNGVCVQQGCKSRNITHLLSPVLLQGPPLHLYISPVESIPETITRRCDMVGNMPLLPPGLILIPDFISQLEESKLLEYFTPRGVLDTAGYQDHLSSNHTRSNCAPIEVNGRTNGGSASKCEENHSKSLRNSTASSTLKHRTVSHYGYEFIYSSNNVDPDLPLPGGIPDLCDPILKRMISQGLLHDVPDQLTVNDYLPGAGIPAHIDTHSPFEDGIASLSLGSQVVMDFKHPDGRKVAVFLPERSLLVMTGESRYLWAHRITPRKMDEVNCRMPGYHEISTGPECSIIPRGRRVSLTFRKVKRSACTCNYPSKCDSQTSKEIKSS